MAIKPGPILLIVAQRTGRMADRQASSQPSAETGRRKLILCFDGTGYNFRGDEGDSNVLKIFRMLDRKDRDQYRYFQPGFGTYVSSTGLSRHGRPCKPESIYLKAKDAAVGSSFADHVVGGYTFLTRYFSEPADIYIFGFSRGAYVARLLASMIDYIGLLDPGNEGLIPFAWTIFYRWQKKQNLREMPPEGRHKLNTQILAFRETFCRPVCPVHFMGLFDTVNSVRGLKNTWLRRSKCPFPLRPSSERIRHAVSIDERRANFHPVLISKAYRTAPSRRARIRKYLSRAHIYLPHQRGLHLYRDHTADRDGCIDGRRQSGEDGMSQVRPYRPHLSSLSECELQDIDEVWFPGSHADVGGGWNPDENEEWPISHVPLAWMVCEAQRAGLRFDPNELKRFGCQGEPLSDEPSGETNDDRPAQSTFESVIWSAITHGKLHDSLKYGSLPWRTVLPWKTLEWLPFRRMRMLPDESWKPVRLPPPLGEWRDIPRDAKIHVSALHRMTVDPTYQPANLCRRDNKSRLISKDGDVRWRMCDYSGSIVDKTYRRIYD